MSMEKGMVIGSVVVYTSICSQQENSYHDDVLVYIYVLSLLMCAYICYYNITAAWHLT